MRSQGLWLSALALMAVSRADCGVPIEFRTVRFVLRFAADGRPASFATLPDGREMLKVGVPGMGFTIRGKAGGEIPMTDLSLRDDGRLVARTANGSQAAILNVHRSARHLGFHLERLKGFPTSSDLALCFDLNADAGVRVLGHNHMTSEENRADGVRVRWPALWQRTMGDPLGGFSLYWRKDDDDEDETMLHIWAEEGLPHPAVAGEWTYERAKQWLAAWQRKFPNRSLFDLFDNIGLEDTSLPRLREAAKYGQMAGVSGVYLMPWIWRGEYWPIKKTTVGINTDAFPRGEADVRAYSDYLAGLGLMLELHYVSGGVGFEDPLYVKPKVDDRLASWGRGRLAEAVTKDATTIRFMPAPGVEMPFSPPQYGQMLEEIRPPALSSVHSPDIIRIEDELVKVGSFEDTDKPVWTLLNCQRGYANSRATTHSGSAAVVGLIVAYGQNLLPDNGSTLLDEIAGAYASFMNRCNVATAVFDGAEIHDYWGYGQRDKYGAKVYERLDHPTASATSAGRAPKCWLEYRFNSTRRKLGGEWGYCVDLRLDRPSWEASTALEANFTCSQPVSNGIRALGVRDHHGGVTLDVLKTHGETRQILETVRNWRNVERLLTPEQKTAIRRTEYPRPPLQDSGWHPHSDVVWVLSQDGGRWLITPTRVMKRKVGDVTWRLGQEHGILAPRQYAKPGDTLQIENPFAAQEAHFVVRVLYATDYAGAANLTLQPQPSDLADVGDTEVRQDGNALALTYRNSRADILWNESGLPFCGHAAPIDMSSHRAIGMWVTGDGSNSVLVLQIPQRDYVVPIDFSGRRYVEIPNGEAAWAEGRWGWRMGTWKIADYAKVPWTRLGFGKVPGQTAVSVKIEGLKALAEIPAELVDPVVHTGTGVLRINGKIATGEYLVYSGGDHVSVCDRNWNKLRDLPVEKQDYVMPSGYAPVSVEMHGDGPEPWLETQFLVHGDPLVVADR